MPDPILSIEDLRVTFTTEKGDLQAVDGVSLSVQKGRILGVVGESGCGKSVTALSILRLVPDPPGKITNGRILWKERDLLQLPIKEMPDIRGTEIAMIFQDPLTSLNPVFSVGRVFQEVLKKREGLGKLEALKKAEKALAQVGIPDPRERLLSYPHELSGGMKQRVLIALALLSEPELLIADEPTTALDVTIQKQILYLIKDMQKRKEMSVIFITHDLGVIAELCDDVAVMYAGKVVEKADVYALVEKTRHPYTEGLMNSIPRPGIDKSQRLYAIKGTVPSMIDPPRGCRFASRCPYADEKCKAEEPPLREISDSHFVACHYPLGGVNDDS